MDSQVHRLLRARRLLFKALWLLTCILIKLTTINIHSNKFGSSDIGDQGRDFRDWYDFIIIGSGSSGSVIANRLSEVSHWNILLIEAGDSESLISDIPGLVFFLYNSPSDWSYKTEPQDGFCQAMTDKSCRHPRGKVLGGSSTINGLIYCRGNKKDYDNWAASGNSEWSYEKVLPYFKKSEDVRIEKLKDSPYHATGGYLTVEQFQTYLPLSLEILNATRDLGYETIDVNGEKTYGFTETHATMRDGFRCSTAKAFLRPAGKRINLDITINSRAEKIIIDPDTKVATGVVFKKNGKTYTVNARKEVILSAGVFNSPHLLMLSGIGPEEHLREIGISPIISDLKVGHNLQDHIALGGFVVTLDTPPLHLSVSNEEPNSGANLLMSSLLQVYGFTNTSYSSSEYPDIGHYFSLGPDNLDVGIYYPNIFGYSYDFYDTAYTPILFIPSFLSYSILLRPKSRGWVRLKNSNPDNKPLIFGNYLTHPHDVKTLVEGTKFIFDLIETPTMKQYGAKINPNKFPGCEMFDIKSDEYIECALRQYTFPLWHPAGTCKMGPDTDPEAVVTSQLKVRGVKNLRVADASIMPEVTSGNLNAPCIMIGEMVSDFIKEDWLTGKSRDISY